MSNETITATPDHPAPSRRRRTTGFVLAGLALAGAGVFAAPAIAGAQDTGTDGDSTVTEVPHGPGVVLDELVAEGVISEEQADAIVEAFQENRQEIREIRGAFDWTVVSEALDMTPEEIREGLVEGQSLADLAEAQGVPVEDLIDAIVAERQSQLDDRVAEGVLTQDQADEIAEGLTDRVSAMVNGERPDDAPGRPFGRRGGFGIPGAADAGEVDATGTSA